MSSTERFDIDSNPNEKTWTSLGSKKRIGWGVLLAIIICGLVTAVIVLAVRKSNEVVCSETSCIETSRHFLSGINESVNPCEDFYNFTCSKWQQNNLPLDENERLNQFGVLQEKIDRELNHIFREINISDVAIPHPVRIASRFYRSCPDNKAPPDKEELIKILKKLDPIGGWPIINPSTLPTDNWISICEKSLKAFGKGGIMTIQVGENAFDTSKNILILDQSISSNAYILFFSDHILTILNQLEIDVLAYSGPLMKLIKFYQILLEISPPSLNEARLIRENYITIRELKDKVPSINWISIIESIVEEDPLKPKLNITLDDEILVNNVNYFKEIVAYFENGTIESSTLANYIGWDVLVSWLDPVTMLLEYFNVKSKSADMTRVMQCLNLIKTLFNYAVDFAYTNYAHTENIKTLSKSKEMIEYLRDSFRKFAHEEDWLDKETLNKVDIKLNAIKSFNEVPSWVQNKDELEQYYEGLHAVGDFEQDFVSIIKYFTRKHFNKLRSINTEKEWFAFMSSTVVNAFYYPSHNLIMLPIAIQNLPFYEESRPWYLNFGAIGVVVGHEITHGFDNSGSLFDEKGNFKNWWTVHSRETFNNKATCFKDQYSEYTLQMTGTKMDGLQTLGENIADNGGMRQSYDAFKRWEKTNGVEPLIPGLEKYTREQLFFISYASIWCSNSGKHSQKYLLENDEHSPAHYRVNSVLSNFDKFSEVFQCKPNSKMNPQKKCIIW